MESKSLKMVFFSPKDLITTESTTSSLSNRAAQLAGPHCARDRSQGVTRAAALGMLAVVFSLLALVFAAPASAAPSISVSPNQGLNPDGDFVTVNGSGFEPNSQLFVMQCRSTSGDDHTCNSVGLQKVTTDGAGNFSRSGVKVTSRFGATDCFAVPCAVKTSAVSGHADDRSSDVFSLISFRTAEPPAPPPPPSQPTQPSVPPTEANVPTPSEPVPPEANAASGTDNEAENQGESGARDETTEDDGASDESEEPETTTTTEAESETAEGEEVALVSAAIDDSGSGGGISPFLVGFIVVGLAGGLAAGVAIAKRR